MLARTRAKKKLMSSPNAHVRMAGGAGAGRGIAPVGVGGVTQVQRQAIDAAGLVCCGGARRCKRRANMRGDSAGRGWGVMQGECGDRKKMPPSGIEPPTFRLRSECSTTEL
jgi:hypothetical protein